MCVNSHVCVGLGAAALGQWFCTDLTGADAPYKEGDRVKFTLHLYNEKTGLDATTASSGYVNI